MERTVRLGEMGIEGLKFIRGTSADVFSICAGVLAGGPMTPTGRIVEAAVGATLDAAFQAADTYAEFRQADSALAGALVTGFGKFSVRAIPLRKAGRDGAFAIAGAVIFLEATTDFTVGLVEGNPVKDALKGAAIGQISGKVVGGALGSLMRERAMLDLIGRGVLPATTSMRAAYALKRGVTVAGPATKWATEAALEGLGGMGKSRSQRRPTFHGAFAADESIIDKIVVAI
jgi:hypothetical protein